MSGVTWCGTKGGATRAPERQCAVCGLDVRSPRLEAAPAVKFLIEALQCSGKGLLAMKRPVSSPWKTAAASIRLSARLSALVPRMRPLLVSHLPQASPSGLQFIAAAFLDCRVMSGANNLKFLEG